MSRARNLANLGNKNTLTGISTSGRVGIGSTIPDTKLDVDGTITATSFSGDGSGLSGLGTANVSTSDLFVVGVSTLSGNVNITGITTVGILTAYDSLTVSVWTLGADGTNHYTFTGPGDLSAENDPDLQLIRGQRYIFRNRSGGHPFRIQSTVNGSAGTAYNDGVTNNDAADGNANANAASKL